MLTKIHLAASKNRFGASKNHFEAFKMPSLRLEDAASEA
jgi:hypothetical protein